MGQDLTLSIIVVEDDLELQSIFLAGLRHFGHDVRGLCNGRELDAAMTEQGADIVILDLGLPGEDGLSIARRLRGTNRCGIIMVTARGRVHERIDGLQSGADMYFVKPVDILELEAAITSLHRRMSAAKPTCWFFNPVTSTLATPDGVEMSLTAQECLLMQLLLKTPGRNVARREIFQALNQPDDQYADKRLEAMVSRLRRKLKRCAPSLELPVRARHTMGYAFLADAKLPSK